jgi:LacI family transcriptional regulator
MATLYDCAALAGVSTATVSRVLHGQDRVSDATRARVLAAIEELAYVPDGAAQSLSRRAKHVIGLASLERFSDPTELEASSLLFGDQILHGVETTLRDRGWSLLITFFHPDEPRIFPRLYGLSGKVDGLIITEGIVTSAELARLAAKLPVVVVAGAPNESALDVVVADNRAGSAALTEHLISAHRVSVIHYVAGPASAPDALERRAGFDEVLTRHPEVELCGVSEGTFSTESGRRAIETILSSRPARLPDAIVCANDQMAIGAIQALAGERLVAPDDLAVVGFDGIYPEALLHPPLTTVRQPIRALGERACARLLERIDDPGQKPRVEMLTTELVIRASCGCKPARPSPARSSPVRSSPARLERRRAGPARGRVTGQDSGAAVERAGSPECDERGDVALAHAGSAG